MSAAPPGAPAAARWYSDEVIAQIPRVLTLIDRDPTSPTFGCLDRNYWHYRTQDFPSGMYQELALPLAQVFVQDFPDNPWRGEARVRELVDFTKRRAWWLVRRDESGRLTNHHALVALAAARAAALCGDDGLRTAARERLGRCLEWQHAEGWFAEYEGADLGYQSLTIAFLSALAAELPSTGLDAALERAAAFLAHFLHPDGSLGGEVGSRNTCQVLPSGFERLAVKSDAARFLADGWLAGARAGKRGCADDDRIFCHWMADYLEAYAARVARPVTASAATLPAPAARTSFPECGLHVVREGPLHLVVASTKGGAFRVFSGTRLLHSDTGIVLVTDDGARLVMHVVDPKAAVSWSDHGVTISGRFEGTSRKLATPFKQVAFRVVNGTVGRAFPHFVRKTLQKALITGRAPAAYRFERRLSWSADGAVEVSDLILRDEGAPAIARALASTDATSIYVATSNLWQDASREPWAELPDVVRDLNARGTAEVTRRWR